MKPETVNISSSGIIRSNLSPIPPNPQITLNIHFFIFDMKILIHNEKKSDLYGTCYPQGTFNLAIIDRLGFNVSRGSAIELTNAS